MFLNVRVHRGCSRNGAQERKGDKFSKARPGERIPHRPSTPSGSSPSRNEMGWRSVSRLSITLRSTFSTDNIYGTSRWITMDHDQPGYQSCVALLGRLSLVGRSRYIRMCRCPAAGIEVVRAFRSTSSTPKSGGSSNQSGISRHSVRQRPMN